MKNYVNDTKLRKSQIVYIKHFSRYFQAWCSFLNKTCESQNLAVTAFKCTFQRIQQAEIEMFDFQEKFQILVLLSQTYDSSQIYDKLNGVKHKTRKYIIELEVQPPILPTHLPNKSHLLLKIYKRLLYRKSLLQFKNQQAAIIQKIIYNKILKFTSDLSKPYRKTLLYFKNLLIQQYFKNQQADSTQKITPLLRTAQILGGWPAYLLIYIGAYYLCYGAKKIKVALNPNIGLLIN
eukprot:TRINITY_DN25480_c0_g1_i10.p2 TRINITY_DN25480_c0_g1~~TRINITY_DN25480_c0_g1_i10.p2  ORF type:complete len:235 (-),score=-4.09 TRINITY_DN25480_c0_g1_i10:196-900(-)